ncbi:MAG: hypothetical protein J0L81_08995 [Caulobacterales bacterium]|jgi:hypothetical protein|nr:hypothetical protein [Caulobacterales bacterium]
MKRLLAACAALALAGCATPTGVESRAAPPGRDCFHADAVNGYEYVDEHSVAVRVGANRRYILSTEWNARDLNWEHVIAIRSTTSWICTGAGLGVEIIGGEPRRHYPISSIARAPDQSPPPPGSR